MAKKSTKKVDKKGYESKKKIWLIINFVVIMLAGLFFVLEWEIVSIASVVKDSIVDPNADTIVYNLTTEIVKNSNLIMNKAILCSMGTYSIVQIINYVLYLFNKKSVLMGAIILEAIILVAGLVQNSADAIAIMGVPIISALIYLRILKLEESK